MSMPKLFVIVASTLLLSACATNRIAQHQEYAVAGEAFSEAVSELTREASILAIDSDTKFLMLQKTILTDPAQRAARETLINNHSTSLDEYLDNLRLMRKHMTLLNRYFASLSQIGSDKIQEDRVAGIGALVSELGKVGVDLSSATIGGKQVSGLIPTVTKHLVASRQNKLLEAELEKRKDTILKELDIQQAYLVALQAQMERDLKTLADAQIFLDVAAPFISDAALPLDWADRRRKAHATRVSSDAAGNAALASKKLKSVFVELVEGKPSAGKFAETMQSINKVLDIVDVIENLN